MKLTKAVRVEALIRGMLLQQMEDDDLEDSLVDRTDEEVRAVRHEVEDQSLDKKSTRPDKSSR